MGNNFIEIRKLKIGEGRPKICIPLVGRTERDIFADAERIKDACCDIVEWRADWFDGVESSDEVLKVLKGLRSILDNRPLLFTFRSSKEGGQKELGRDDYIELNRLAVSSGSTDLIDLELFAGEEEVRETIDFAHANGVKVIVSNHDFDKTPDKDTIVDRLCRMQALGADIPKIAVMPNDRADVLTLLSATLEMAEKYADRPIVTMSMAGNGLISRLSGEIFGSAITFGTAGMASAPGQIDSKELSTVLDIIHFNIDY